MIKRIGILTFHAAHNYGSMLQAYAMQTYLKNIGVETEIINLRTNRQKTMYEYPLKYNRVRSIVKAILYPRWMKENIKKWHLFECFLRNNLYLTQKEYHSWKEIEQDLSVLKYDAILCGGDQIWNLNCPDFNESYLLPSPLIGIKKISYSPSAGGNIQLFTEEQKAIFRHRISAFDYISVRDMEASHFMTSLLKRTIPAVADPTLLLKQNDYEKLIEKNPIIEGEYMLYYTPYYSKQSVEAAHKLASHYNLKLVTTNGNIKASKDFVCVQSIGPKEFLNVLKYAKFICGQSFHLIAFSLIFHKEFVAIDGNKDARMKGLLNLCHLDERGIDLYQPLIKNYPPIDYSQVDIALEKFRSESIKYIKTFMYVE